VSDTVAISGGERPLRGNEDVEVRARETPRVPVIESLARAGLRGMWFVAIPALLAGLVLRYLVPTPAEAQGTWADRFARFADDHEVILLVGIYILFSVLARYWYLQLPGGRLLTPEPVEVSAGTSRKRNATLVAVMAVAAVLAVVVRGFLFGSYRVLSASMLPTLEPNDLLGGSRLAYGGARVPERGDIVVFKKPEGIDGPDRLIKRVIGIPGDRIAMNGGHVVLNGIELPSCDAGTYLYPVPDGAVRGRLSVEFLEDRAYLTVFAVGPDPWPVTYDVKPGEVFVIGDNRNNSTDSRFWNHGKGAGLRVSDIEARAKWRLFGAHRNDRTDFTSFLRPLELDVRLEGMDVGAIREGIERCLQRHPVASGESEAHVR
jgi:signal peptidase I